MIAKKVFTADGVNTRFLSDFIIQSEQFARVYAYIYDNTLNPDGTEDVLQNPLLPWDFPSNLYKRGANAPSSGEDLLTIDKWDLVTNSILTYEVPLAPTRIWIEVATTPEEFGETLTQPSVELAESAAANALASKEAAIFSATEAELEAWNAEAYAMTSDAYATTNVDTFVSEYTSNGDGTFTETPTTNYSALHYAAKVTDKEFVHLVDDIADLLLVDPIIYSTVNVRGYYTPNDGGGGLFNYDATQSAVNNGGTIINGWVRQYSGRINVKWFGAKTDDNTFDNGAVFNNALSINRSIYIPNGYYYVSTTFGLIEERTLSNWYGPILGHIPYSVSIIGESQELTIISSDGFFADPQLNIIEVNANPNGNDGDGNIYAITGVQIENMTLRGRSRNDTDSIGMYLRGVWRGSFKNIKYENNRYGVFIDGVQTPGNDDTDTTSNITFTNCCFNYNKYFGLYGVRSRIGTTKLDTCELRGNLLGGASISSAGLTVINSAIALNGTTDSTGGIKIVSPVTGAEVRGNNIIGCMFEANAGFELRIEQLNGGTVQGCVFHPSMIYTPSVTRQSMIELLSDASAYEVNNVVFTGNRIQSYSGTAVLSWIRFNSLGTLAKVVDEGVSKSTFYASPLIYYTNATKDGFTPQTDIALTLPVATVVGNVTGDGTAVITSTLASTILVANDDRELYSSGTITIDATSYYNIDYIAKLSGAGATFTQSRCYLLINGIETAVNHNSDPSDGTIIHLNTRFKGKLIKGDVINFGLSVSGGTKVLDLERTLNSWSATIST